MNILFVGGKTAGHLLPGVALAKHCLSKGDQVQMVCTQAKLDRQILQKHDLPFIVQHSHSPLVSPVFGFPRFAMRLFKNILQIRRMIKQDKVSVVVGLGGYPCLAGVLAARLQGVPVVLLEQNVLPGKANRFLARFCSTICLSFEQSRAYFAESLQERCKLVGNPLCFVPDDQSLPSREKLCDLWSFDPQKPIILGLGGSQGASSLNDDFLEMASQNHSWQCLLLTGYQDYPRIAKIVDDHELNLKIVPFYERMHELYTLANACVCRAGAGTIHELIAFKKPAVLVPMAQSADGHQMINAQVFKDCASVSVLEEKDAQAPNLIEALSALLNISDEQHDQNFQVFSSAQSASSQIYSVLTV